MERRRVVTIILLSLVMCCVSCRDMNPQFNYETYQFINEYPLTINEFLLIYNDKNYEEIDEERSLMGGTYYEFMIDKNSFTFYGTLRDRAELSIVTIRSSEFEINANLIGKNLELLKTTIPVNSVFKDTDSEFCFRSSNKLCWMNIYSENNVITYYEIVRSL